MAWNNKPAQQGQTAEKKRPAMACTDWLLYCFEQQVTKSGDFVRLQCKLSGGKNKDGTYKQGLPVSVMCRIACNDSEGKLCNIPEQDYGRKWIHVSGKVSCDDFKRKDGTTGTELVLWAEKVHTD